MYILPHLCMAKDFWSFKILDQIWKVFLIFKVLDSTYFRVWMFFDVVNKFLSS
jgi:hypothetical protein